MFRKECLLLAWAFFFIIGCCHRRTDFLDSFFIDLEARLPPCRVDKFKTTDLSLILNTYIFYDEISELYLDDTYFDDFNALIDSLNLNESTSLVSKVSLIRSIFYYRLNNQELDYDQIMNDFDEYQKEGGYFLKSETMTGHLLRKSLLRSERHKIGDTLNLLLPINGDTVLNYPIDTGIFIRTKLLVKDVLEEKTKICDLENKFYLTYTLQFLAPDNLFLLYQKICRRGDTISIKFVFDSSHSILTK